MLKRTIHTLIRNRNSLLFLTSITLFLGVSCRKDPAVTETAPVLFNITELPLITLEVSLDEWNRMLGNFDINPMNDEWIAANCRFQSPSNDIQLDSIAIRIRGNTSRRRPEGVTGTMHDPVNPDWHHAHFSLNFDEYRTKQQLGTLEKLNVKWFKDDPAYVREIYCYDLFQRFGVWTAPRASYCKLRIHVKGDDRPAYFGIYAMIESVGEDFIEHRQDYWGKSTGFVWKGGWANAWNADFIQTQSIGVSAANLQPALSQYYAYDLKTRKAELATAKTELLNFIQTLNSKTGAEFKLWIEQQMDIPLFLKTYAVNVILGMWDDYWVNGNNFYFYCAPNGKKYFIPYDYDNTLGTSAILSNAGTQDPLQWGSMNTRPLINKILQVESWHQLYKSYLKELVDPAKNYFYVTASKERITAWHKLINNHISNDTGEDMFIEDKPAFWGNAPFYRLLSGNDQGGQNGEANFFTTRAKQISW